MPDELRIDPDRLREVSPELGSLADDVAHLLGSLQSVIAQEGACWGEDRPGEQFAQYYQPDAERGVAGIESLVDNLTGMSTGVSQAAEAFEQQDLGGAAVFSGQADSAVLGPNNLPIPELRPSMPTGQGQVFSPNTSVGPPESPGPESIPTGAGASRKEPSGPSNGATEADSSETRADRSQLSDRADTSGTNPDTRSLGDTASRDLAPEQAGHYLPRSAAGPSVSPPAANPPRSAPVHDGRQDSGRSTNAPGAGRPSASPWAPKAASGAGPPKVSAPTPPGPIPPRIPSGRKKTDRKSTTSLSGETATRPTDSVVTGPAAMRVVRDFAARHGLQVIGFESAGAVEPTIGEIIATLDSVLARFPLLHVNVIEVRALPSDELSRVEWDGTTDDGLPDPRSARIILDRTSVTGPGGVDRTASESEEHGPTARPICHAVVHALGVVLDGMGGFRARTVAQKTLIAEYLRVSGAADSGQTLARVVDGYREWRGCPRFAPQTALADAFTEVALEGDHVRAPVKVLHRLLVEMALNRLGERS